jgi:hypothetical protein
MFQKIISGFALFEILGSGLLSFVLKKKTDEWKTKHDHLITFFFILIFISAGIIILSLVFMLIMLFTTTKF